MASVQELKDALALEQDKAAELAERSFQAIDTITNQANFWLSVLSVGLALIGIVGLALIYGGARRLARKIANERINSYINSDEGKVLIQKGIESEVKSQLDSRQFVIVQPKQDGGSNGFPTDPKAGKEEV